MELSPLPSLQSLIDRTPGAGGQPFQGLAPAGDCGRLFLEEEGWGAPRHVPPPWFPAASRPAHGPLSQSRAECGVELALSWDSTGPWLLDACPCLPSEQFSQGLVCLLRTERARPFPLSVPPGNLVGPAAAGLPPGPPGPAAPCGASWQKRGDRNRSTEPHAGFWGLGHVARPWALLSICLWSRPSLNALPPASVHGGRVLPADQTCGLQGRSHLYSPRLGDALIRTSHEKEKQR